MRVTSSSSSSHASPPHSHNNNQQKRLRSDHQSSSSSSSSLLRIIGVAIAFVLAFHWYLILHHVSYHAPNREHNPFLTLSLGGKIKSSRRRGGRRTNNNSNNGKEEEPYILSYACGGCYRTYYKDGKYCHDLIQEYMQQNNGTSIHDASRIVGQDVNECSICNPDTCYSNQYDIGSLSSQEEQQQQQKFQTKYWRFDETAPQLNSPTSLLLPSIPDELRIPQSQYTNDNIESYIREKYAKPDPANITNVFLMEYNPGIAPIPTAMKEYLPSNAVYVLSLRVTPHNFCFGIWLTNSLSDDIKQTMHSLNHLGLALLDEEYQIIQGGYNVVIDIDRQLGAKREHVMTEPAFVDFRLFTLNDELYLHINSDTVILTRLRLRSKTIMKEKGMMEHDTDDIGTIQDFERDKKPFKLKNLYGGDTFEVTLLHQFNTIWGQGKESIFGKNYALYSIPNLTHPSEPDSMYAEMSVYPEHKVMQILPDLYDKLPKDHRIKWRQRRNFKVDHIIQRQMKSVGNATVSDRSKNPLIPSFFNVDEHWFPGGKNPFKEFAHGGACCVTLSLEGLTVQQQEAAKKSLHRLDVEGVGSLLVGVGHTLVKYYTKNKMPEAERVLVPDTNYVSFFYAFNPRPPFDLVAKSGYFCLGFANDDDSGTPNPRTILTHNRPLQQNNVTFDCPQIHYVETIIEKVGDSSSTVIGYGLNDCVARLVEVSKSEIAKLLFPDPLEMVFE